MGNSAGQNAVSRIRVPLPSPEECAEVGVTPRLWAVLVDAIFPSAKTTAAVLLALKYCQARRVDILKKMVHIVPLDSTDRKTGVTTERETVWPSIALTRIEATRSGEYCGIRWEYGPLGQAEYQTSKWTKGASRPETIKIAIRRHEWIRCHIKRLVGGQPYEFEGPYVYFDEVCKFDSYGNISQTWKDAPIQYHQKNTEAATLRVVFPEASGTELTFEEVDGATTVPYEQVDVLSAQSTARSTLEALSGRRPPVTHQPTEPFVAPESSHDDASVAVDRRAANGANHDQARAEYDLEELRQLLDEALDIAGIKEFRKTWIAQVPGHQKQAVNVLCEEAIARLKTPETQQDVVQPKPRQADVDLDPMYGALTEAEDVARVKAIRTGWVPKVPEHQRDIVRAACEEAIARLNGGAK